MSCRAPRWRKKEREWEKEIEIYSRQNDMKLRDKESRTESSEQSLSSVQNSSDSRWGCHFPSPFLYNYFFSATSFFTQVNVMKLVRTNILSPIQILSQFLHIYQNLVWINTKFFKCNLNNLSHRILLIKRVQISAGGINKCCFLASSADGSHHELFMKSPGSRRLHQYEIFLHNIRIIQ